MFHGAESWVMSLDRHRTEQHLKSADLQSLFIEELGWDHPGSRQDEEIEIAGQQFRLSPVAEKRGVKIFRCGDIPERPLRQKIEKEVTKRAFEHLIVFIAADNSRQIWQWVAREKGKPDAFREHSWLTNRSPEPLLQKLDHITFSLEEEEALTLAGTTLRLRDAFDREKITKKFYDAFKNQHDKFLGFIEGLTSAADKQWYASLMLNRLMFVYFIQKKGFLDGDINYLKNRLAQVRETQGEGKFHSFYRAFLLKLFHGGLATPMNQRDEQTAQLIGCIPYLNGGLFEPHILEGDGSEIQIVDEAFEAVFAFFDQYEWTLDTRAIERADGREINPDVLGHIFEKYINQKQMGAYYTKEDITDYITKNTVIPWLFQNAQSLDKVAFEPSGVVWRLMSDSPGSYIYPAVSRGIELELPAEVAAGIDDVSSRGEWNKEAAGQYALPTEIWRETIARRLRYQEVRAKIETGHITKIEDLITYNLDIRQFAQDVIQYAESPDLVRAFWKGISSIKVLDPACGSGAFLFAALGILYDLYDACLERMEQFVSTAPEPTGGRAQVYSDFREVLKQVSTHPNRAYYIYKSIIISNLYGVDIMDEAVEICKLRLFLKLAAQLERPEQIEPLPDIDFNIRAGNSLIGYTSFKDVKRATEASGFDFDDRAGKIEEAAEDLDKAFQLFRQQQTELNGIIEADHKSELRRRLAELGVQLDRFLANDYGIEASDDLASNADFQSWKSSHKPFHWLIEFYGIVADGGFDAIVGNPPYLMYPSKNVGYGLLERYIQTISCKNLYAFIFERSLQLAKATGPVGKIVPLTVTSSARVQPLQNILRKRGLLLALSFPRRPQSIFDGVEMPVSIILSIPRAQESLFTSSIIRFSASQRDTITEVPRLIEHNQVIEGARIAKLSSVLDLQILNKLSAHPMVVDQLASRLGTNCVYYQEACRYWLKASNKRPRFFKNGQEIEQPHGRKILFQGEQESAFVSVLLNSSLFYWFYSACSDCEHVNDTLVRGFWVPRDWSEYNWIAAALELNTDMARNAVRKSIRTKNNDEIEYDEIAASKSKQVIDENERMLASIYGLTDNELDYVANYDIKYRLGASADDES